MIGKFDKTVNDHLMNPENPKAKYASPKTQNELINIFAHNIILEPLLDEIRQAKFFTILADEITSHNTEQLAFVIRFVDRACEIREEFISFSQLEQTSGLAVSTELLRLLETYSLDCRNMRGQGYDGAGSMSSERIGVQRRSSAGSIYTLLQS